MLLAHPSNVLLRKPVLLVTEDMKRTLVVVVLHRPIDMILRGAWSHANHRARRQQVQRKWRRRRLRHVALQLVVGTAVLLETLDWQTLLALARSRQEVHNIHARWLRLSFARCLTSQDRHVRCVVYSDTTHPVVQRGRGIDLAIPDLVSGWSGFVTHPHRR